MRKLRVGGSQRMNLACGLVAQRPVVGESSACEPERGLPPPDAALMRKDLGFASEG